jgi:hypothetical protein
MKQSWMILALLAAGPALAEDAPVSPDAVKIMECMRANVPSQLTIGALELTVFDRTEGSRTLKGRLFTRKEKSGLMHASLHIDAPVEFKGAAYLVQETDDYLRDGMFVYLPGVKRVRRITGTFADASLMGTNFSYFDFKQMENAFGDLRPMVEGLQEVNGRPTRVLRFEALPGAETQYTIVRAWIDQQACVAVRGEFFSGNKLIKQLSSPPGSLKQAGSTWYVSEIEMRDPSAGTRTLLRIGKLDSAKDPAAIYFDPNSFFLGP